MAQSANTMPEEHSISLIELIKLMGPASSWNTTAHAQQVIDRFKALGKTFKLDGPPEKQRLVFESANDLMLFKLMW